MKEIMLTLLLVGIIFITNGYLEINTKKEKEIEYRYIPRNVYESIESNNMEDDFSFMFNSEDIRNKTNLV